MCFTLKDPHVASADEAFYLGGVPQPPVRNVSMQVSNAEYHRRPQLPVSDIPCSGLISDFPSES